MIKQVNNSTCYQNTIPRRRSKQCLSATLEGPVKVLEYVEQMFKYRYICGRQLTGDIDANELFKILKVQNINVEC